MIKIMLLAISLIVASPAIACAEQRYNPMENRWETTNQDRQTLKYNSMEGNWSYQPDNARPEYNPMENRWDWNSGQGNERKRR